MNANEFYEMIDASDLSVKFIKLDGTERTMKCTTNLPPEMMTNARHNNGDLITVYDIERKGWRSFYLSSVISVTPLDTRFQYLGE